MQWLVDYYRNDWPFDMVVIDELSSFKNHNSKRFKALKLVRPLIKKIVGLTGTPAPNGYIDLWAQIYLLDQGERLGKFITHYRQDYFNPDKRNSQQIFTYKPKDKSVELIKNKISDICISLSAKDYLQMPEKVIDNRYIKLDSKAEKEYKQFEKDMFLQIDEDEIDVTSAVALSNKLLQFCNGAVYKEDSREYVNVHSCKLEALLELIEEAQRTTTFDILQLQTRFRKNTRSLKEVKVTSRGSKRQRGYSEMEQPRIGYSNGTSSKCGLWIEFTRWGKPHSLVRAKLQFGIISTSKC